MRRREKAALVLALVAIAGCGVDSYLTCGAPCDDSGAVDATVDSGGSDTGSDGATNDAGNDVAAKDVSTAETGCLGAPCQGPSGCCGSAPICNAGHHCAATCGAVDASCSTQNDTCCVPGFCNGGRCSACLEAGAPCSEDWQCCGNACVGSTCQ